MRLAFLAAFFAGFLAATFLAIFLATFLTALTAFFMAFLALEVFLAGAVETIRRFKPKLQISVYHKQQGRDDLADVPTLISRVQPAYRYYLGHHGSWGNETILYAICP